MASGPLFQLTLTRWRMFLREPSAVFWTFGFPILLSLALGVAFRNRPPGPVRVAIEQGAGAEALSALLAKSEDVRARVEEPEAARRLLRSGRVSIVVIPGSPRTYRFDESRPESRLARLVVDDRLQRAEGRRDASAIEEQKVREPGARYIDFLLPGIIGMNIMSSGMWGIGYLIAELRSKKLIKRMVATPMKRSHFLLSFVILRMMVLVFELPVLLVFGRLAFGVQMQGSILLFMAVVLLGSTTFAGLGLLTASRATNTQTVSGLINLVMLPMFMCSGVFFSSENFPAFMQPLIQALPLTALNGALRAIMNEGAGVASLGRELALLAGWGAVSFGVSLKIFRWR